MKDQNIFKQTLYNHTLPVREDVWAHVEANLPKKRRRLPFLWIALAGFFALGASVAGFTMFKPIVPQDSNTAPLLEQSVASSAPVASAVISTTPRTISVSPPETPHLQDVNRTTVVKNSKSHFTRYTHNSKNNSSNTTSNSPSAISESFSSINLSSASSLRKDVEAEKLAMTEMNGLESIARNHKMSKIKPDPSCYKFSGANGKNALSFDVFGGPGFAPRSFEATDSETAAYVEARETTEKPQYGWEAGARLNLNLQKGFALRLGISYEQMGDVFNYTDPNASQKTTSVDSFFAADGSFLYADTNVVLIFGKLIKKIHNKYTRLDIPLLVSFELPFGRSTLMLNAGPVLNLTSTQRGQILDPSLNPVHITEGAMDEIKAYKHNLGLSLYLGAGALLPITDNISALIEPRLLYRINPVTLDTYPLKEHRSFAGLNLGIRYHFN